MVKHVAPGTVQGASMSRYACPCARSRKASAHRDRVQLQARRLDVVHKQRGRRRCAEKEQGRERERERDANRGPWAAAG